MATYSMVDHYDENLHHMAEPSAPADRERAVSITMDSVQAAVFRQMLREWAVQRKIAMDQSQIALGYVEWIERQFKRGDFHDITLYAHTSTAEQVIDDVLYDMWDEVDTRDELLRGIEDDVAKAWGRHHTDEIDDPDALDPAPTGLEGVPDG